MPATASAAQLSLPLLLPEGPATVAGIPGQLDIVAAVDAALSQLVADRAALADDDAAAIASTDAAIAVVAALTVNPAAEYDAAADRQCHGRTKAKRRCSDRVVPEWKGSLVLSDGRHYCRQHAHQGLALTR